MNCLVVGGTGFVGRVLVGELLKAGHTVSILHRRASHDLARRVGNIQADRNDAPRVGHSWPRSFGRPGGGRPFPGFDGGASPIMGENWMSALDEAGLGEANLDLVTDIIACPGLDYCSLANARSIPLAQKLSERFADPARQQDLGELKIKISGCINACGHHHAGNIGILGVDRKGSESYQLLLGGSGDEETSQAKIAGPGFDEEGIVDAIERAVERYRDLREPGERFIDTYRRVGMDAFKEAIYV